MTERRAIMPSAASVASGYSAPDKHPIRWHEQRGSSALGALEPGPLSGHCIARTVASRTMRDSADRTRLHNQGFNTARWRCESCRAMFDPSETRGGRFQQQNAARSRSCRCACPSSSGHDRPSRVTRHHCRSLTHAGREGPSSRLGRPEGAGVSRAFAAPIHDRRSSASSEEQGSRRRSART